MNFGKALEHLKMGERVYRQQWNGKGMYLLAMPGSEWEVDGFPVKPCIAMKTAQDEIQPGWLASQADMLAEDWFVLGSHIDA